MDDKPIPIQALSQAVLQLHRGSREWPAASFQPRACELIESLVAFDACLWGSVALEADAGTAPRLQGLYAVGLDSAALTRCLDGEFIPGALLATGIEPLAARRTELRLWRAAGKPPFDTAEHQTLQFLMPHLVEAQRENRLSRPAADEGHGLARRCHAVSGFDGVLQQIDEHCLALLRTEWPRWRATRLPDALVAAIAAIQTVAEGRTTPFHGRQITVLLTRSRDGVLLETRRRDTVDRLSTRQRDIALLYADGHTGPQIATQLGLSPSTVNNHLGVIFKKLSVSNKVQLLHAVRGSKGH